jgi:hypothetical protein
MVRRTLLALLSAAIGVSLVVPAAAAKPPPVTKIKFKLDAHEVVAGTPVTGGVQVWTRTGSAWQPLSGAELTVKVDGVLVGTAVTGGEGYADVSYPAPPPGEHVMKVVFADDDTHERAQRAQGFTVVPGTTGGDPTPEPTPEPAPEPTPEPTPETSAVAPDAPVLAGWSPSTARVRLQWTLPASDGGSPITGYRVYRSEESGGETFLVSVPAGTLTFDDTSVRSRQFLYYVVTAVNAAGESAWSNEVEVAVL